MTRRWLMDEWRDIFVTELRLRGIPGQQIGEALAEVDAHSTDSGQTPGHAFGDPVGYAAARSKVGGPDRGRHIRPLLAALKAAAVVSGAFGLLTGAGSVAHHVPGTVTAGQLIPAVLAPPLTAVIVAVMEGRGRGRRRAFLAWASRRASPSLPCRRSCARRCYCASRAQPCSPAGYFCSAP